MQQFDRPDDGIDDSLKKIAIISSVLFALMLVVYRKRDRTDTGHRPGAKPDPRFLYDKDDGDGRSGRDRVPDPSDRRHRLSDRARHPKDWRDAGTASGQVYQPEEMRTFAIVDR